MDVVKLKQLDLVCNLPRARPEMQGVLDVPGHQMLDVLESLAGHRCLAGRRSKKKANLHGQTTDLQVKEMLFQV